MIGLVAQSPVPKFERGPHHLALLAMLSVIAGLADVIGYFSFDHIFTAHITGNLAVAAIQLVERGSPHVTALLSIPVFALTLAFAYGLARHARSNVGRHSLLIGQSVMFLLVLGLMLRTRNADPHGLTPVGAMLAVAAIGFQNAFVRVWLHQGINTSAMTANVVMLVLGASAWIWRGPWSRDEATDKVKTTWPLVLGFFVGCAAGAAGVARLGLWAWSIPALLSVIAIPISVAGAVTVPAPGGVARSV